MAAITEDDFLKWATSMGLSSSLPPESFKKLLTPQMRSCWSHILKHFKPKEEADVIRKNILLSKLRRDKLSRKDPKKLPVKINRLSQIDLVKIHESIVKKLDENYAEINSRTNQIEDLTVELNKMGKIKKTTLKSIEVEEKAKLLLLKEKKKQFEELLKLKDCTEQMRLMRLPQGTERPNSLQTTTELSSSMLDQLEELANLMNEFSPSELFDDPESKRDKLHSYVWNNFRNTSPLTLLESLAAKLRSLSQELAVAATTKSKTEEMDSIMKELEYNAGKTFYDGVKDLWLSFQDCKKEIVSLQNSTIHKREKLEQMKKVALLKALNTVKGEYEDDMSRWIDTISENILVNGRINVLVGEINSIHLEIDGLESSSDRFFEFDQAILELEHNIKCEMKQLEYKLTCIKKKSVIKKVNESKKRIVAKIHDFQQKQREWKRSVENSDPFSCLRDYVKTEVLLLNKLSVEALQLHNGPKHITQNVPHLPMYSPYTPVHFILQDILEKLCGALQSVSVLDELKPSPPIEFDIYHLIEETNSIETENQLILAENVAELKQKLNAGNENIKQVRKSISFWKEPVMVDLIPQTLLFDGRTAKWWKENISKYLQEE